MDTQQAACCLLPPSHLNLTCSRLLNVMQTLRRRMLVKLTAEDVRTALGRLSAVLGPQVDVERLVEAEPMFLLADIDAVSFVCALESAVCSLSAARQLSRGLTPVLTCRASQLRLLPPCRACCCHYQLASLPSSLQRCAPPRRRCWASCGGSCPARTRWRCCWLTPRAA